MSYFNFFSQFSEQRNAQKGSSKAWLILLLIALAVICGLIYLYYGVICDRYNSQLDFLLNDIKGNAGFQEQHAVAVKVAEQVGDTEKELKFIELLDDYTITIGTANVNLLNMIDSCMTDNAKVNRIEISDTTLKLEGTTSNVNDLTTIERNFREQKAFSSVFVSTIENNAKENTELVEFSCELKLNGGAILNAENEES